MEIIEKVKVVNRLGLHLRAAAELVRETCKFKSRIHIKQNQSKVDGKSLLNLVTLAAGYGSELTLIFDGEDARDASKSIRSLFLNKFGEKE